MWIIKRVIRHFIGAFLVCLLLNTELAWSQNPQNDTTSDDGNTNRPVDEGMEPLYTMTNIFLGLVQPESKGHIIQKINFTQIANGKYTI